jgi:hypothetical protein
MVSLQSNPLRAVAENKTLVIIVREHLTPKQADQFRLSLWAAVIVSAHSLASWTFLTSDEFLDLKLQKEWLSQQTANQASSEM